jgi:hypothetical protein
MGTLMQMLALHRQFVFRPLTFKVDQRALPRAEHHVL